MKELLSFVDENGSNKEVLRVLSQYHPSLVVIDIVNLQTLMSMLIKGDIDIGKNFESQARIVARSQKFPTKNEYSSIRFKTHSNDKGINQEREV